MNGRNGTTSFLPLDSKIEVVFLGCVRIHMLPRPTLVLLLTLGLHSQMKHTQTLDVAYLALY